MTQKKRTVAIVAPHFPPSNLAGVHRARLFCQHLHEFYWHPVVLTTHWRHYEEALDWELAALVDPQLEVIHTRALPTKPIRAIGDIGIRSFYWHVAALKRLQREGRLDFLLITIPSFYSALIGEVMYRGTPLPFGIDYIDPWVHDWPGADKKYSKAWASMELANRLEPLAVKHASLISGVAEGYFAGVLERNPHLRSQCVTAAMPYGFSTHDFEADAVYTKSPFLFNPSDGNTHFVYAGALLPRAVSVLKRFLEGLTEYRKSEWGQRHPVRVHFIGTGKSPNDQAGYNVRPLARELGVLDLISEHPHRMAYLDVLVHLKHAAGVLVVGSTEAHYTPSKVYQAVQSRRPVLAFLHQASTAVRVLEHSRAGMAITLTEQELPSPGTIAEGLKAFLQMPYESGNVDWGAFEAFSARQSARKLAEAMDVATDRFVQKIRKGESHDQRAL